MFFWVFPCPCGSVQYESCPVLLDTTARCEPRLPSGYSDSLRAGRSGDLILVGARFSASVQTGPEAHPASYTMGKGSFPGVKRPGRGVDHLTLKKEYSYTSNPLWAFVACSRPNFSFTLEQPDGLRTSSLCLQLAVYLKAKPLHTQTYAPAKLYPFFTLLSGENSVLLYEGVSSSAQLSNT